MQGLLHDGSDSDTNFTISINSLGDVGKRAIAAALLHCLASNVVKYAQLDYTQIVTNMRQSIEAWGQQVGTVWAGWGGWHRLRQHWGVS